MDDKNLNVILISVSPEKAVGGIATWTKGYLSYCYSNGIMCKLINTEKMNNVQRGGILNEYKRTKRIIQDLKKQLGCERFDIAHLNTSIGFWGIIRDYFLSRFIVKKTIPLVLHFHCDIPFWDHGRLKKIFLSKILKLSNHNFALCKSSQRYLLTKYNAQSELLPNFIDSTTVVDEKIIGQDLKTIIYTGRVSRNKGAFELYELANRFPNITFFLIGQVLNEISEIKCPENVILAGVKSHEEVLQALEKADAFLFPSHSEGFSIALTEAMAKGLPCIVSDVGANSDMIGKEAGFVTTVGDIEAMANSIDRIRDIDLRRKMSIAAIQKVKDNYTVEAVMQKILNIYKHLVNYHE